MIILAGMIGVGKSSYTEMIARRLGTKAYYESVEYNPFLDKYYDNPKEWAFSLQLYFLNQRFKSIKQAIKEPNNVLDRSIYEDALFTEVNYSQGNICDLNMGLYREMLHNLTSTLNDVERKDRDLLVYLDASFETILEHIVKRGRDYEQIAGHPERLAHYELLYKEYEKWYENYNFSEKVKIPVDKFDIIKHPKLEIEVMEIVWKALNKAKCEKFVK